MWNKIAPFMILVITTNLLLIPFEAEARGGRGGGGGGRSGGSRGGGGAYRGGRTMNRTPTMSRASSQPASRSSRPSTRPAVSQGRAQQARQASSRKPSAGNRQELRSQVSQYAQKNRPSQGLDRNVLSDKAQNFSSKHGSQLAQSKRLSDRTSQRLRDARPGYDHWFDRDFFDRHAIDVDYAGRGLNWWRPAAWTALASWGTWDWATPYYYDEGGYAYPVEPTYYSTTTTPTQSVVQPEESTQNTTIANEDWLPLGVFAVANDASTAVYSNRFVQLAINKSGEVAGVLYNSTTDTAQDLTGMVDPTSQQVYWTMADRLDSPIASTGIYNLTEDETPINVYFPDGSDQTWTLVRLQK